MARGIEVKNSIRLDKRHVQALIDAANLALEKEQAPTDSELTILVTDEKHGRELNRQFLGHDYPTDVLSFPAGEPIPGDIATGTYLGDIAICAPVAKRQALAKGHSLQAELQLLVVHGVLHLLNYDHADELQKARMWSAQQAVLEALGLEDLQPTEE